MNLSGNTFYYLLWGSSLLILVIFYIRHTKRIRTFLLGSSTGLTALFLMHIYGGAIGFAPTLCMTNLLTCSILGIPGMILIILTQIYA